MTARRGRASPADLMRMLKDTLFSAVHMVDAGKIDQAPITYSGVKMKDNSFASIKIEFNSAAAVNSHAEMLAALKWLAEADPFDDCEDWQSAKDAARTAIANAERAETEGKQ